ncbi:Aste57867_24242 [Aphanomyces stellatus]|uniref:Aste57867_24242 protein n=1 Tax=Aphanomyces stellatus TaxID=120398 RepID=A0A485LR04_9STRA|nr:hypothetical protein As57867_024167 [Aphanomyces stellatus]VFU00883.1 Aste57867_24242 [Aphanomyces stellatus]
MSSNQPIAPCMFLGCINLALHQSTKCHLHRHRTQCIEPHCTNQVYARQRCVRHGGKKICAVDFCGAPACKGGFCLQHGGTPRKRFCTEFGCGKQAHANQKCVRHGGGRYCKANGCTFHARLAGYCLHHNQDLEPLKLGSCVLGAPLDGVDVSILECLVLDDSMEGNVVGLQEFAVNYASAVISV